MEQEKLSLTYINTQDDYFEYQLFQKYWDCGDDRTLFRKQIRYQLIVCALLCLLIPFIGQEVKLVYFGMLVIMAVLFIARYVYEMKGGYLSDYNHMLALYNNLKTKRIVNVYDQKFTLNVTEDELELVGEQGRRYCCWNDFEYVQQTNNLIVMRIKPSNKPNLQNFEAITVSKRYIFPEKVEAFLQLIEKKRGQYDIPLLTEDPTNPYLSEVISNE